MLTSGSVCKECLPEVEGLEGLHQILAKVHQLAVVEAEDLAEEAEDLAEEAEELLAVVSVVEVDSVVEVAVAPSSRSQFGGLALYLSNKRLFALDMREILKKPLRTKHI
jgi:hypothetical protein